MVMAAPKTLPPRTLDVARAFALCFCEVFLSIVGVPRRTLEAAYRLAHTQEAQNPCLILILWRDAGSSRGSAELLVVNMNTSSPTQRQGRRYGGVLPEQDILATSRVNHLGMVAYASFARALHIASSILRSPASLFTRWRPPPLKGLRDKVTARFVCSPTPRWVRVTQAEGGCS